MRKSKKTCGVGTVSSGLAVSGTATTKTISGIRTRAAASGTVSRKEMGNGKKRVQKGILAANPPHSGCSKRTRRATTGLTIIQNAPVLTKSLQKPTETTPIDGIAGAQYVTFLCDIKASEIPDSIVKAAVALGQDNLYVFRKSLNSNKLTATSSALDIFTNWLKYSIKRLPRARTHKKILAMPLISQLALSRMFVIKIILERAGKANNQAACKTACKAKCK
jgi:hypothetical protein